MRGSSGVAAVILLSLCAPALAQDPDELAVPPPPSGNVVPPPAVPPLAGQALGQPMQSAELVLEPLLTAAEHDLTAGRIPLALARTTIVRELLTEGMPLRVRADGLALLAQQRMPDTATEPALDEVYAPLMAQAELDLRAGQLPIAMARLDLVLARLPESSPLHQRARALRRVAAQPYGAQPPPVFMPAPTAPEPIEPPRPEGSSNQRGTGEAIELYITSGLLGALTGAWIAFLASEATASTLIYGLTMAAGAGVFAVGVLSLDLTNPMESGIPPTISSSIRFGFIHGLLAWGVYERSLVSADPFAPFTPPDPAVTFSLIWGGAAVGAIAGLGIGFGLTPSVREARFVESMGFWGAALGTYIALLTDYDDVDVGLGLTWGGLDLALLTGAVMAVLGAMPSTARTLWLDLAFLAGSGAGAVITLLVNVYETGFVDAWPWGLAMMIGGAGAWALTLALTGHVDEQEAAEEASLRVGIAPLEGGAAATLGGTF